MGAPDLLQHLRDSGLRLGVDGDLLTVTPRDRLTDELRQAIREFKPALLTLLNGAKHEPIQSPYWPNTEHANDTELNTMEARLELLIRRGMGDFEADLLADKLLQADREQSGQVTCHLCQHFNARLKTCGNFRAAGVEQGIGSDLAAMLQRCPGFQLTRQ